LECQQISTIVADPKADEAAKRLGEMLAQLRILSSHATHEQSTVHVKLGACSVFAESVGEGANSSSPLEKEQDPTMQLPEPVSLFQNEIHELKNQLAAAHRRQEHLEDAWSDLEMSRDLALQRANTVSVSLLELRPRMPGS
jgi:hypothetical protein